MFRLFRKPTRISLAIFGMLLVGGAVAFAQHHATLTQMFASAAKADSLTGRLVVPEVPSNRPLVKLFLAGAIERDSKTISLEKAGPVAPGEVVTFTMTSVNEGSAPAREYRAVGQIPRGANFVAGSAHSDRDNHVSYSLDGLQFSSTPMIDEKQADGTIKRVVAPISLYTQVRFEWVAPLEAYGKLVASYQVRIR